MTTIEHEPPRFDDDAQLQEWVHGLLHPPTHRQLWALFLDEHGTQIGPLMPCDDLPIDPDDTELAAEGDDRMAADACADLFARVQRELGLASLVIVWEHRGGATLEPMERAWASRLGEGVATRGGYVRAQFLLHRAGVRQLGPDDLR